ncbi:MAG: MotA/TolQ/ExbB proton channel family protein [Planctomycetes bacterium]|nr:MotA/TolQ/ExbB proton channel family protein [Planctomycetota bacterium]
MLVGSCERRRDGFLSRLAGVVSGCVSRVLVAACLAAAWAPVATCLSPAVAMAQDEEVAVDDAVDGEPEGKSYLAFLVEALGIKYVIIFLLLSFALVALLVMCFMQFRKSVLLPQALSEQFEQHLENKEFQQAYELAKNDDSYLGRVLAAGMGKLQSGYPAAVEAMQAAESEQAMSLEHKISYVSLVGALAPMFGLLGTVDGMVAAFMLIAQRDTAPKPSELAVGISQALVTTLIGLWLAIPAIACYGMFKNWLQRFNMDVDDEAMRLMARFQNMGKKAG